MSIIRINKNNNYTVMSNYHFREKNMSLKAKGLLSLMLSLPDDWDYSIAGLVSICKENKTAITNTLNELKEFGYLVVTKLMPNKAQGRSKIEYVYDVFEQPQELENQDTENLCLENVDIENQPQLNTNISNTKKLNTKKERKKERKATTKTDNTKSFNDLIDSYTQNEQLRAELKEHLKTRKSKKSALTNRAIELSLKKLDDLATTDADKILIVQNAIMRGWTGFFPLKDSDRQTTTKAATEEADEYSKYNDYDMADFYKSRQ